jgi:uncharacterized membrane protein
MDFGEVVDVIGRIVEGLGIAVIVVGVVASLARYGRGVLQSATATAGYGQARQSIGRSILLGLELLVAGDIIRTVVVDPTFESVGVLAIIVALRTFLSFTLEVEITSRWPWQGRPDTPGGDPQVP